MKLFRWWKINYACFGFIEDVTSKFLNDCIICVIYRFKSFGCYMEKSVTPLSLAGLKFCLGQNYYQASQRNQFLYKLH